jgi:uncharacterized peroxidase-related enzyme
VFYVGIQLADITFKIMRRKVMNRISSVSLQEANPQQAALYDAITEKLGMVPNFLKVFANSPVALEAFLGLHGIAGQGSLDAKTQERIALALAEQNSCQYCVSAHTAIGRKAGLDNDEIEASRAGTSNDEKAAVAVRFAQSLVEHKGDVTNAEIQDVRDAGYSDAELVEIITHVGMNLLTNILAKTSRVDIDFPKVELKNAA